MAAIYFGTTDAPLRIDYSDSRVVCTCEIYTPTIKKELKKELKKIKQNKKLSIKMRITIRLKKKGKN